MSRALHAEGEAGQAGVMHIMAPRSPGQQAAAQPPVSLLQAQVVVNHAANG